MNTEDKLNLKIEIREMMLFGPLNHNGDQLVATMLNKDWLDADWRNAHPDEDYSNAILVN